MKRYLQYHWWKYLLAILLPLVIWSVVFDSIAKPKRNEMLRILYVGEAMDVQSLQNDLSEALPQMTRQPLKEITVTQMLPNGLPVGELLTAEQFNYDILILPAEDCPPSVGQNFFSPLSEPLLARFPESTVYTETVGNTALPYGIVLHGGAYASDRTGCILFFSTESVNLASLNGKGRTEDDAALCAAIYLAGEAK